MKVYVVKAFNDRKKISHITAIFAGREKAVFAKDSLQEEGVHAQVEEWRVQ